MFLTTGPSPEFMQFVRILCWIFLPVLFSAVLFTIIMHYRKKKAILGVNDEQAFLLASPEQVGYTKGDGEFILFDHSRLILEYKNRLTYNHARFTALQHDFAALEERYLALSSRGPQPDHFIHSKISSMENQQETMSHAVYASLEQLKEETAAEKRELESRIQQLGQSFKSLEEENMQLSQKLQINTGTDDDRSALLHQWKEENTRLKDQLSEQEYLADLLEEKNAQIRFLQTQLEQRVKNQRQAEQQHTQLSTVLQEINADKAGIQQQIEAVKEELLRKQEESDRMQMLLCEREEREESDKQILNNKLDHISYLENQLRESKEHNEVLVAEVADSRDIVNNLQQQLADEQERRQFLDQRLQANKQNMRRLYKEFSSCIDEENERSPVIALRRDYTEEMGS